MSGRRAGVRHKASRTEVDLARGVRCLDFQSRGGYGRPGGFELSQGELYPISRKSLNDPREAWLWWLRPVFGGNESCYFTGTYSDEYGFPHGLTLVRNVHKDFRRWLDSFGYEGRFVTGVERHRYRDILHLHGILEGPFTVEQRVWLAEDWRRERGFARSLPVRDGCESYVTKYALKGDTDAFDFRLGDGD